MAISIHGRDNYLEYMGGGTWVQTDGAATKSTRETAFASVNTESAEVDTNWGKGASRSLYNVFANQSDRQMMARDLMHSRLWKGVPQLTHEQLMSFEAAYTGHTFFFVIDVPRFMTQGIYQNTNMHQHCRNLKAIIERASTSFSDGSSITANFDQQEDGNGKKLQHVTSVEQQCDSINIRLHEFAGLPVKNAIEAWLTGIYDINSQHGNYHGNLGVSGGWCTVNHSMSLLVVQVDPSWTEIQDAAYYYNMIPTEVPFDHWSWEKGTSTIVQDAEITFNCNKLRNPAIMYAAEKFMNARILSMVETSVFNTRQFVPHPFGIKTVGDKAELDDYIMDNYQYNIAVNKTTSVNGYTGKNDTEAMVNKWTDSNNQIPVKNTTDYLNDDKSGLLRSDKDSSNYNRPL